MKIKHLRFIVLLLLGLSLRALPAAAKTLDIQVNGMVCAFCAQGIEKKFKSELGVQQVKVDLEHKHVQVITEGTQDIDDARIMELIREAGFVLVQVIRSAS